MTSLVPVAASPQAAFVMQLLDQSSLPVPKLRRKALTESCRMLETEAELRSVFMDVVCDSHYVPAELKQELAEKVLLGRWHDVARLVGVRHPMAPPPPTTETVKFVYLKDLAVTIFRKSRKIKQVPLVRRRVLGNALLSCRSREELFELLVVSLETAVVFDEETRFRIANDIWDNNFHSLLLEDRFDCDELPRLSEEDNDSLDAECIICFGPFEAEATTVLQGCGHEFCRDCIQDWARLNGRPQFPCPICRRESTLTASQRTGEA